MAEYLLVPATRYLIPLGNLDPREVAPLTDAGLTSYHAVKRSLQLLGPGSTAVVIGAGGLGQMAIQMLRALCAATTIVAVDTRPDKLEIAKKVGADEGLFSGDEAVTRIKDITGGQGAELVLDLVAVDPTLAMAAQMARVLGHLTIVGVGNAAPARQLLQPAARVFGSLTVLGFHPRADRSHQPRPDGQDPDARRALPAGPRRRGLSAPPRRQDPGTRRHHTPQLTKACRKSGCSIHRGPTLQNWLCAMALAVTARQFRFGAGTLRRWPGAALFDRRRRRTVHPDLCQSANSLVQHEQSDDHQDHRHQRGVVPLQPVLEPSQRLVQTLTRGGIAKHRHRH